MRNRSIGFIFLSVLVWAFITYFLFLDRPIGKEDQKEHALSHQIDTLKKQVKQQISDNQLLLEKIIEQGQKRLSEDEVTGSIQSQPEGNVHDFDRNALKISDDEYVKNAINKDEGTQVSPENHLKNEGTSQLEKLRGLATSKPLNGAPVIPVIVFSCNRVTVRRCLDQLIKLRPSAEQFPIIVSQDCNHQQTSDVIRSFGEKVVHIQQPDQSDIDIPPREKKFKGYFKIARHYGWALNQVFLEFGFETAIIVEDDLDIAPDFFEYFLGTYPLLIADKSLWCISAWNDNGKLSLVDTHAPHLLYRTDFFPGLGWMLTRELWLELSPKWPKAYWDDWIRQPEQRKDRACIRPELSRTRTFGKIGVSNGLFYEKHLKFIKLNDQSVPFTKMNLTYLLKSNYDIDFMNGVYQTTVVSFPELKGGNIIASGPVRIPYFNRISYKTTAKMLGLMDDFRSGVPRTGYRGVVTFFYNNRRVHLAPNKDWNGYDITWS
ncbi:alpha-1,3-mannosyl-glycoprotein 2-beta-N-acetylglucosaminyltransferase [Diachasma alloeum]|uniref:alpha-1,3-mannosyl-glycoprotein 2-beta-N-acetylglucosaminyltransferase n=1 Tax=Diachasma alloeum TaxID=454923 RepID=UPI0007382C43|nr:alpha-1,3-mannosyl-glycoprotein 2-beta-N-acetylglucosaminyltransferase [Diachasma alloeum]XP_015120793.1 alpha-1,3-mannosyl-glycoprotein 2-beta-N-acetylglucosaminyltransferase [Diachasma alloeum]XP_015120794.1 alpha-1,3-mannosyl-glycoprotein 2-beta-N-acetylglucosaminyltransferase [Diachasma alloeum]XP_015120796.1 alpha-1,3-mannosyl-glycoprotein 2-beta-N-acetylglucosaminyltransferase [Diachasma alloeum]XP_015120798.1 alpha-1,3-mannosyl-glycoprotein 2-beta-N-acetylglucosaminyltransferase [Diac